MKINILCISTQIVISTLGPVRPPPIFSGGKCPPVLEANAHLFRGQERALNQLINHDSTQPSPFNQLVLALTPT